MVSSLKAVQQSNLIVIRELGEFQILTIFNQFRDNYKIFSCSFYLKEGEMKVAVLAHFKEYHGNHKKILRVNMVLGDAVSKLEAFVWILNHISRSIT